MTRCLASDSSMGGLGCDNMTVILICFIRNEPYQSLVDDCIMMMDIREKSRKKLLEENSDDEMDDTGTNGVLEENNTSNENLDPTPEVQTEEEKAKIITDKDEIENNG